MTVAFNEISAEAPGVAADAGFKSQYLDLVRHVEQLHRLLLDVIRDEFDRHGYKDLNSVQALLVYNIGDSELTAGELRARGYYLGSNVSYNLKKLVKAGYLQQEPSAEDRRVVLVSATEKGREISERIDGLYERQVANIEKMADLNAGDFGLMNRALSKLERFWTDKIRYRL